MSSKIDMPTPGKYKRKAINHPDKNPSYGKKDADGKEAYTSVPRTQDPNANELLIIETVKPDPGGQDIIGKIKYVNSDAFKTYATSFAVFAEGGWEKYA